MASNSQAAATGDNTPKRSSHFNSSFEKWFAYIVVAPIVVALLLAVMVGIFAAVIKFIQVCFNWIF